MSATSNGTMESLLAASREDRFTAIATSVWEPLQRYVRRRAPADDVDDIVAETLTVLWRRLDEMPAGAELPWTYSVARRCLANHRRSAGRRRGLVERITSRRDTTVDAPDAAAAAIESTDPVLGAALARLSADDREVLTLWAWEQLTVAELAVALGISENTASARLGRARRRLAADLGERRDDGGDGGDGDHRHRGGGQIVGDAGHTPGGRTEEMPR